MLEYGKDHMIAADMSYGLLPLHTDSSMLQMRHARFMLSCVPESIQLNLLAFLVLVFEHALEGVLAAAAPLLVACPAAKVIAHGHPAAAPHLRRNLRLCIICWRQLLLAA
jgi:hypothetical protein